MNFRALTLIVLMATWLVPAHGSACLPDATGIAAHGHEQGFSSHSHGSAGRSDVESGEIGQQRHQRHQRHQHSGTTDSIRSGFEPPARVRTAEIPNPAVDELTRCCESGRTTSSVDTAVENAEPRPESSPGAVLPSVIATVSPDACLTTTAQLRSQQPPPLPYEKNRRPLLI